LSTQVRSPTRTNLVVQVIVMVVGIALVLIAQFLLDNLADTSDTWHNLQHGSLFVGGIGVGIGGTLLWVSGRRA
jgi:hypothetical protein